MAVNQIAVFIENKKGRMHRFTKTLSDGGVNIEHMAVAESTDYGIIRAITSDNNKAVTLLKANGYTVHNMDIIGVEVSNKPGELTNILQILEANNLDIEYMYSFPTKDKAIILIRINEFDRATKVLNDNNIKTL